MYINTLYNKIYRKKFIKTRSEQKNNKKKFNNKMTKFDKIFFLIQTLGGIEYYTYSIVFSHSSK